MSQTLAPSTFFCRLFDPFSVRFSTLMSIIGLYGKSYRSYQQLSQFGEQFSFAEDVLPTIVIHLTLSFGRFFTEKKNLALLWKSHPEVIGNSKLRM